MLALTLPTLFLAAVSATYGFYIGKELEPGFASSLYTGLGISLLFFWLFPSLSYLGTYLDIYQDRLVTRKGIFGTKRVIEVTEFKDISLSALLKGYPKPKALAAELLLLAK